MYRDWWSSAGIIHYYLVALMVLYVSFLCYQTWFLAMSAGGGDGDSVRLPRASAIALFTTQEVIIHLKSSATSSSSHA